MANSTLSPGRPSSAIVRLREAAMKEMEAPQRYVTKFNRPVFDHEHDVDSEFDESVGYPQFHGEFNPHVGNGSGPIG